MKRISIFLVTLFFFFSGVIFASTAIELKSGQKVEGELIEETADYIRMNVAGVELAFYKDEIKGREEKKPVPEAPIKTEVQAVDHKAAPALSVKKVYAAYQVAVQSSDIKGLRKYVFSQAIAELDDVENAAMVLNLMKKMSPENVKIIDEKVDGETATLTATAEGMFGSSRGVISFVKEEGAWKLVKENWEAGRSIETKAGESENLKPPVDMTVNDNAVGVAVDNLPVSTKQIIPKTMPEALKLAYEQSLVIEEQTLQLEDNKKTIAVKDDLIIASNEASIKAGEILVREFVKSQDLINITRMFVQITLCV